MKKLLSLILVLAAFYANAQPFTDIPATIEAEDYSDVFNATVAAAPPGEPGGGDILGFIADDTWMEYEVNVIDEADFVLDFRASSPFATGVINILDASSNVLGTVNLTPATADYDTYAVFTSDLFTLAAGNHTLRLDVVASGLNLNWIEFRSCVVNSTCDDGDPGTLNDRYDSMCNCTGIPSSDFVAIPAQIEAEDYHEVFNATVNPAPAGEAGGGDVLGNIGDDTWMEYNVSVSTTTDFEVDFRASSPFGIAIVNILNEAGETLGTVNLAPATGDYDVYDTFTSSSFILSPGDYTLRLDVEVSAMNLNWIEFKVNDQLIPDGTYPIKSATNAFMYPTGTGGAINSQATENGTSTEWEFVHLGDNVYSIYSAAFPTERLGVISQSCAQGQALGLDASNADADYLKWKATESTGGLLMFSPLNCPSYSLDIWQQNSSVVHIYDTNPGENNQLFDLFAPLPVDLVSFKGIAEDKTNMLQWLTASEINVEAYIVERSDDTGRNWTKIGNVPALGKTNYDWMDSNPLDISYYRLKMLDLDGSYEYSPVLTIKRANESKATVFPVPTTNLVTVQYDVVQKGKVTLSLRDLLGRKIYQKEVDARSGEKIEMDIQLEGLDNGIYLLNLENGSYRKMFRVVKH